jgi:hypothetical protein
MRARTITMKPKAPWQVTASMIAVAAVIVLIGLAEDRRERVAAVEAARSASYGEVPKPEDHGR